MSPLPSILIAGMLVFAASAADAQPTATIDAAMRKQTVEGAIRQMNERYVFPEVAKKTEAALTRNLQNNAYEGLDDAAKFATKLTEDLQAMTSDKHIRVRYSENAVPICFRFD